MQARHYFRLGLFALAGLAALVILLAALGWHRARGGLVHYRTYFDESVQGLDRGAPVKFRGVLVGSVSRIAIAPDHRHVAVELALERSAEVALANPALRTQLATQGVTGVRFIDIDLPTLPSPPPALPFPVGPRYIPSRPSLLGGLATDLQSFAKDLPALLDSSRGTVHQLERLLAELHEAHVPDRLGTLIDTANQTVAEARRWLAELRHARFAPRATETLDAIRTSAAKLDRLVDRLGGVDQLVASARRATDSMTDLGRRSSARLEQTLDEVDDAARAMRELAELLEREPDSLLKGRARPRSR